MAAVKTKKDVSSILISHREEIEKFGVRRLGLFGSFAREKQKKTSDIDMSLSENLSHILDETEYITRASKGLSKQRFMTDE